MPKVYNRLQSWFVSLAWPWSGRSFTKGNQWECRGPMWLGSLSSATNYLTNPKPDRLISCHMAGCLASCSWLAGWLPIKKNKNVNWTSLPPNIWPTRSLTGWYFVTWLVGWPIVAGKLSDCLSHKMSTWPSPMQRHLVAICVTTLVT